MSDDTALVPMDELGADPKDVKAWEIVTTVLNWMAENACYNYAKAFRALTPEGQPWRSLQSNFGNAMKRPFVQGMLAQRFQAQDAVAFQLIEAQYYDVIRYQLDLARGKAGNSRDATAAARFIADRFDEIRDRLEGGEDSGTVHPAMSLLQNFQRKVTVRRVTEEVEFEETEESEDIVEGEIVGD